MTLHTGHRSKLFVPGNRPELFDKALASGADAISIDLEDAVPAGKRDAARRSIAEYLDARKDSLTPASAQIVVRLNSRASGLMIEDLLAVVRPGLAMVNVPKVEDPVAIEVCADVLAHAERRRGIEPPLGILATIETPAGVRRAAEIAAAHPRLAGLQFGVGDFAAAMGLQAKISRLMPAWLALVGAAREAGIAAYDSAYLDIDDLAGFAAWAREARACGFQGKSCIHPSQVEACNAAFSPTATELEQALAVVAAYDRAVATGRGALTHRGRLVDYPIAEEARRIVALADRGSDQATKA